MSRSGLTWSTVRITSSNRVTSPRISVTSFGMAANGDTECGFRSMHVTVSPRPTSRRMSRGPMNPVPPITSIAMALSSAHPHVFHDAPALAPTARPHHVEVAARVSPDAVARAEAGVAPLGEALAPGAQMRAVGGELVDARVPVAVGDEHLA